MIGGMRVGVPLIGRIEVGCPAHNTSGLFVPPSGFSPSLDFSDERNSQFVPLVITNLSIGNHERAVEPYRRLARASFVTEDWS